MIMFSNSSKELPADCGFRSHKVKLYFFMLEPSLDFRYSREQYFITEQQNGNTCTPHRHYRPGPDGNCAGGTIFGTRVSCGRMESHAREGKPTPGKRSGME